MESFLSAAAARAEAAAGPCTGTAAASAPTDLGVRAQLEAAFSKSDAVCSPLALTLKADLAAGRLTMAEYTREARTAGVAAAEVAATLKQVAAAKEASAATGTSGCKAPAPADIVFPAGTYYGRLHESAVHVVDGIFVPVEAPPAATTAEPDVATSLTWLRANRGAWGQRAAERLGPENDFLPELELHDESRGGRVPGGKVDSEAAEHIARALRSNRVLRSLNIGDNNLQADGAAHLAWALSANRTLTSLNLAGNDMGDAGAQVLAKMVRENVVLTALDVRDNGMSADGEQLLRAAWGARAEAQLRLH